MDEIDWKKTVKKVLMLFIKVFGGLAILLALSVWGIKTKETQTYLLIALLIGVVFPAFLGVCYIIIIIIDRIINPARIEKSFDDEYIKELPKDCSPAIVSLVYDLKIDTYKDYTATILYLCMKKYIKLIKEENTYKFNSGKNKDFSNLGICEKYVIDIIINKKEFDELKFKQNIIEEAKEKGFIKENKSKKVRKLLYILGAIILFIILSIGDILVSYLIVFMGLIFSFFIWLLTKLYTYAKGNFNSIKFKRTENGKKLAVLFTGLKRYIKDYTLIKDKTIDYIQILENYIPYALALGEADAVEEFIKYHEQYRDLIYNRKSTK